MAIWNEGIETRVLKANKQVDTNTNRYSEKSKVRSRFALGSRLEGNYNCVFPPHLLLLLCILLESHFLITKFETLV